MGISYTEAASEIGVARNTVITWCRKAGVQSRHGKRGRRMVLLRPSTPSANGNGVGAGGGFAHLRPHLSVEAARELDAEGMPTVDLLASELERVVGERDAAREAAAVARAAEVRARDAVAELKARVRGEVRVSGGELRRERRLARLRRDCAGLRAEVAHRGAVLDRLRSHASSVVRAALQDAEART